MEQMKNKNTYLIACVSCIVLLLTFCYFGINLSWKTTYSANTSGTTSYKCTVGTLTDFGNSKYAAVCLIDPLNTFGVFTQSYSVTSDGGRCMYTLSSSDVDPSQADSIANTLVSKGYTLKNTSCKTYSSNGSYYIYNGCQYEKNMTTPDNYCIAAATPVTSGGGTTTTTANYRISFNPNGAMCSSNTSSGLYLSNKKTSDTFNLSGYTCTSPGLIFKGWQTAQGVKFYSSEQFTISTVPWIKNGSEYGLMLQPYFEEPFVELTEKTDGMEYDGTEKKANIAKHNFSAPVMTYTYFTDDKCTIATSSNHGAPVTGGTPIDAGVYYVKADANGDVFSDCIRHEITPKKVNVTWSNTSLKYNGSELKPTAVATSGVTGETINLTVDGGKTNAGTYTATAKIGSVSGGRAKVSNYELTNATTQFTITIDKYTITYNANGGSGAPSAQTKNEGVTLTLTDKKPTRSGYKFVSWNTKADGTGKEYLPEATYKDNASITLYAQWVANTYKIIYNANGGTNAPGEQTKTHGQDLPLSTTVPTNSGFTFNGWNTSSDGTGTSYDPGSTYKTNSNLTLYAQWKSVGSSTEPDTKQTFKATFDENSGTLSGNKTLTCETTTSSCSVSGLPTASKNGYTFNGWSTSSSCTTNGEKSSLTLSKNTTYYACYSKNVVPNTPDNNQNVTTNPGTGDIAIAITWFVGLLAVGYSFYYFKTVKQH